MLLLVYYSCQEEENLPPLKIFSITPSDVQLGDTIVISGQGFSPGYDYNEITFTGGAVTYSLPGSTTEKILVEVPDGAQSGEMVVNILDVETAAAPSVEVHPPVIDEVTPLEAWVGDTLTIRGENFQRNTIRNHVKLGRAEATTLRASKTELKVLVPQGAEDGAVSVMGVAGPQFKVKPSVIQKAVPGKGVVGDTIEIQGLGMNALNVTFAPGVSALILTGSGARSVRVVVPAGVTDGAITIQSYINNSALILTTPQEFLIYPHFAEMTPLSGYAGIEATISGHNFSPVAEDNIIRFNSTQAVVTHATAEKLTVTVPEGVTTGAVTITVNNRETVGPVFTATPQGTPIVFAMSPRTGGVGSRVQLDGINFGETTGANTVRFAGNATATIISASATQLIVEVPAQAVTGPVTVTKDGKTGIGPTYTISTQAIPFLTSVTPASARPGTTVTARGGNFNAAAGLVLGAGNTQFTVSSVTATEIVATVPQSLIPGDYMLYVAQGGRVSNQIPFEVAGNPVLQSIDVTEGTPGTIVTITGAELNSSEVKNIVRFGTEAAVLVNPNDANPNTVTVYVPDISEGVYNITLTTFGVTSNSLSFTVKPRGAPVRNILYTENASPKFAVKRRTSDPPSETTLFERIFAIQPINVLTLDLTAQKAYFGDDVSGSGPTVVARTNYDQSGYQALYSDQQGIGMVMDLSLDIAHQKIYITDYSNLIYRGDMDGSGPLEVVYDFGVHGIIPIGVSYEPQTDALYIISSFPGLAPAQVLKGAVDGSGLTELFGESDGLVNPIDVRVDAGSERLIVLDGYNVIKVGNLDGTDGLTTLATRSREILGISLDTGDDYVYWMEYSNDTKTLASVFRQKYDGSTEPEEVYTNIVQSEIFADPLSGGMRAGLVVEDAGGASARGGRFSSMKANRILRRPVKQFGPIARPGK